MLRRAGRNLDEERTPMFRRVLVPVDLTEKNHRAIEVAAELAGKDGEVTLLHVIERIEGVPDEELEGFYRALERRAGDVLSGWRQELGDRGVRAHSEIALGRRAPEIVRLAQDRDADLIVLGSHRVDPERPAEGLGTISHKVALLAQCPVLLVK